MTPADTWSEENQRHLAVSLDLLCDRLEGALARDQGRDHATRRDELASSLASIAGRMSAPPALVRVAGLFGLTDFERDLLLLCAGVELSSQLAEACAALLGPDGRAPAHPTFALALAVLDGAHWSALSPARPLRRWRLIELVAGERLTSSSLRIDEFILHHLTGVDGLDERLAAFVEPVSAPRELSGSHREIAEQVVRSWTQERSDAALPVVELSGRQPLLIREIAAAACASLGIRLCRILAADLPVAAAERDLVTTLWQREAALSQAALLVELQEADSPDRLAVTRSFVERVRGPVLVSSAEPLVARGRPGLRLEVAGLSGEEQRTSWRRELDGAAAGLDAVVDQVSAQFRLDGDRIRAAVEELRARRAIDPDALWSTVRRMTRGQLDQLAQRIESSATWADLVLPEAQLAILRNIALQVRQRGVVYDQWGFAGRDNRGLGITALFSGVSGTGKTMAAEVLASELRLDLYKIDLSQVVNKYIGETEKNLRRAFDAADESGAVLLFDEADALFGKRSEVKSSHDRYANIEVSYLLQRMEAYRGLAILTTNLKSALDPAFMRRLRFVVHFPFPGATERGEIWSRVFPRHTPTEALETDKLARLNASGGNIRNIALNAAFLAAEAGTPVRMAHILEAARGEYAKLERLLTPNEIGGWV
jgi:hypothetical protein